MKKEKIILSFVAAFIGLLVASVAFYLYQGASGSKIDKIKTVATDSAPTNKPQSSTSLTVTSPQDESVVSNKTITISGKTLPDATIVILTGSDEQVVTPASNGDFSVTATISDGENLIEVTAIEPNGQQSIVTKTITYSTETF